MAKYKFYDGTAWVELAKKSDIPSLSGYATQQWVGNNYLALSGGTSSVHFNSNNLPQFSGSPQYLVGIEAFGDGGTLKWQSASDVSVGYANSAGNADTVDSKHSTDFVGYLGNVTSLGSGTTANDTKSYWSNNIGANRIDMCYNHSGAEYSVLFSKAPSGSYGSVLKWGYTDKYLRILRYSSGGWATSDWEKIDAGYADSAGGVAWANVSGRPTDLNDFTNNAGYIKGIDSSMVINALGYTPANSSSLSNYLPTSGGTITNSGSPLLTLKRNTNGGAFIGFKSSNQDTYIWYNGSTSSNALRFSYSSDGGSTSTKKMELDNSGNLEVVGSISEAGTGLSSKYLGINSTAADSSKLNGQSASYYLNYNNLSNTPTIPSSASDVGALPNTTTYGKSLSISGTSLSLKDQNGTTLSTVTIPSGGSSGWSTALYMHVINAQLNLGGTYFGAVSVTYITDYDEYINDLGYLAYLMNYSGPNYDDDLPYVPLVPASGFLYGGGHRYTVYGACYKYKNGEDYVRLAAVNENGSVEYFDTNSNTLQASSVVTDYMIRIN